MAEQLRKLVRVDPRDVWANEATDFTPWLRDNIGYLAEAVGIDIDLVESEVAVGDFSVDLVGEEPGQSRPIIIENQLEKTNHTHLGQLLTYAAGKDGGVIIWVSPEIRPEHRNALEWLNDSTRGNLDFFGVELEVLQIEGSDLKAPNFKVVVTPKTKSAKTAYPPSQPLTTGAPGEKGRLYQAFFQALVDKLKEREPGVTGRKTIGFHSWMGLASGRSGFTFAIVFASGGRFRVEVYIDTGNQVINKRAFDLLEAYKEEIENQVGTELDWDRLDNRRASRISWYYGPPATIMDSGEKLEELKDWTVESFFKFRGIMSPHIQNVQTDSVGDGLDKPEESFDEEE